MELKSWKARITELGGLTPVPEEQFVPLREEELEAIETKFGAKLPEDYREFLNAFGSSTFAKLTSIRAAGPLPPALSDDGLLPFGGFYGADSLADRWPSVLSCAANFHGDIPEGLIPIAQGWEDDQVCLGLSGKSRGSVFYWDSQGVGADSEEEDEEEGDSVGVPISNTHYIAASFSELLNQMERSGDASPE